MILDRLLVRNLSFLTVTQGVAMATGLVTVGLLARALGPEGFGVLGFGTAFLAFFGIASGLGTDTYGARSIARDRAQLGSVVGLLLSLRLVLATLAYLIFAAVVLLSDWPERATIVLLIQGTGLWVTALVADFVFQALERQEVNGARLVVASLLTLGGVFLFVGSREDVAVAALVYVAAPALAAFGVLVYLFSLKSGGIRTNYLADFRSWPKTWPSVLKSSAPMAISGATYAVIFNTDTAMIGFLRSAEEVGEYSAAMRILLIAMVPAGLLLSPFFPRLSNAFGDKEKMHDVAVAFAKTILLVGFPLAGGGYLFADEIMVLVFGPEFANSASVLRLLMISLLIIHLRMTIGPALTAWNAEHAHMIASVIGAGANVGLNFLLIPQWGTTGAAWASIASHVVILVGFSIIFLRRFSWLPVIQISKGVLFLAIAVVSTLVFLHLAGGHLTTPLSRFLAGGGVFALTFSIPALRFGWPFGASGDMSGRPPIN